MTLARFKALCMDASDALRLADFGLARSACR
jgi:hypothetical protein